MKLQIRVGAAAFTALLDSGSMHDFIHDETAAATGLPIQPFPGLRGSQWRTVTTPQQAAHMRTSVGWKPFDIDFYSLPLGCYDMILRVQWLRTLGPILWDFSKHTM
ncbi:LOW QUALITY PROTEIN: hypothetical protein U9M48_027518 [Paspalum notatum var. saurae]|uniref:Uncharacterized protein n=1 Tax=Paspalum notatum var. saurae TaxID=547442 RepID=A0AAQ3TZ00_PASNO